MQIKLFSTPFSQTNFKGGFSWEQPDPYAYVFKKMAEREADIVDINSYENDEEDFDLGYDNDDIYLDIAAAKHAHAIEKKEREDREEIAARKEYERLKKQGKI